MQYIRYDEEEEGKVVLSTVVLAITDCTDVRAISCQAIDYL